MKDFKGMNSTEILEDNNEFLKDYSKGDDMFYYRYSVGFDAIAELKERLDKYCCTIYARMQRICQRKKVIVCFVWLLKEMTFGGFQTSVLTRRLIGMMVLFYHYFHNTV